MLASVVLATLSVLPSHVVDGARVLSETQADVLLEPQLATLERHHGVAGLLVTRDAVDPREPSEQLARRLVAERGVTGKWFVVIYYAQPRYLHVAGYREHYPLPRERLAPLLQARLTASDDDGAALVEVMAMASREAGSTFTGARLRWWRDQTVEFLAIVLAGLVVATLVLFKTIAFFSMQRGLLRGDPGAHARRCWDAEAKAHGVAAAQRKYGARPRLDATRGDLLLRGYSDQDLRGW